MRIKKALLAFWRKRPGLPKTRKTRTIDKAIAKWEKSAIKAADGTTYNTIGDLYLKRGDKKTAGDCFYKAAIYFKTEGFPQKSIAVYKKIITLNQADVYTLIKLAEIYEKKGMAADAIKYYLNAVSIYSQTADKNLLISICEKLLLLVPFNILMRNRVAEIFLKEGLKEYATREYMYIARLCLDRKEINTAKDYFHKALTLHPDNQSVKAGITYLYKAD